MANSIKEYIAGQNPDGSTYTISDTFVYATPEYLFENNIQVLVQGMVRSADTYELNGQALTFVAGELPSPDDRITIQRVTPTSRSTSYSDGSLLNASTLDEDAKQIMFVAEEAVDLADRTATGAATFYHTGNVPPENPNTGDLWYNTNSTPYQLHVFDGTNFVPATPTKFTKEFSGVFDFENNPSGILNIDQAPYDTLSVISESIGTWQSIYLYLNGVRLTKNPTLDQMKTLDTLTAIALVQDGTLDWWGPHETNNQPVGIYFRRLDNTEDNITLEYFSNFAYASEIYDIDERVAVAAESTEQAQAYAEQHRDDAREYSEAAEQDADDAADERTHIDGVVATFDGLEIIDTANETLEDIQAAELATKTYRDQSVNAYNQTRLATGQVEDLTVGWVSLGNNTIETTGVANPVIYSDDTITINAMNGVTINSIPTARAQLLITMDPISPSMTVKKRQASNDYFGAQRDGAGQYRIWLQELRNSTFNWAVHGSSNFITHGPVIETPNGRVFDSLEDYVVDCTYQGNSFFRFKLDKTLYYVDITIEDESGNAIDSGDLLVNIYDN